MLSQVMNSKTVRLLTELEPDSITSSNIGCSLHLAKWHIIVTSFTSRSRPSSRTAQTFTISLFQYIGAQPQSSLKESVSIIKNATLGLLFAIMSPSHPAGPYGNSVPGSFQNRTGIPRQTDIREMDPLPKEIRFARVTSTETKGSDP